MTPGRAGTTPAADPPGVEYTCRMDTLTPSRRRALRAKAHHLDPVVTIGQHGLTPSVLHEIDIALTAHELIKIRVLNDDRDERSALLARICTEIGAAPVQQLGKLLIVWRPKPAPEIVEARPKTRATKPARKPAHGPRPTATAAGRSPPRHAAVARRTNAGTRADTEATVADPAGARRRYARAAEPAAANRGTPPRHGPGKPQGSGAAWDAGRAARTPRGGASGPGPAAKRPSGPHGKSASSKVGASGARRRRKQP